MRFCGFFAAVLLFGGCARNIQSADEVKKGVMFHLESRGDLDLKQMQIEVSKVAFRDKEADATVMFRPNGVNDPGAGMSINYTLEARDGKWMVKKSASGGMSSPHGQPAAPGALPPGHPPTAMPPEGSKKQ